MLKRIVERYWGLSYLLHLYSCFIADGAVNVDVELINMLVSLGSDWWVELITIDHNEAHWAEGELNPKIQPVQPGVTESTNLQQQQTWKLSRVAESSVLSSIYQSTNWVSSLFWSNSLTTPRLDLNSKEKTSSHTSERKIQHHSLSLSHSLHSTICRNNRWRQGHIWFLFPPIFFCKFCHIVRVTQHVGKEIIW